MYASSVALAVPRLVLASGVFAGVSVLLSLLGVRSVLSVLMLLGTMSYRGTYFDMGGNAVVGGAAVLFLVRYEPGRILVRDWMCI